MSHSGSSHGSFNPESLHRISSRSQFSVDGSVGTLRLDFDAQSVNQDSVGDVQIFCDTNDFVDNELFLGTQSLGAYLPKIVLNEIMSKNPCDGDETVERMKESSLQAHTSFLNEYGGVLMLDVSGFTNLTLSLALEHEDMMKEDQDNSRNIHEAEGAPVIKSSGPRMRSHRKQTGKRGSWISFGSGSASNLRRDSVTSKDSSDDINSCFASVSGPEQKQLMIRREKFISGPAETMSIILNEYFGKMVDCVEAHGGDVIKFAGDALICFWKLPDSENKALDTSSESMRIMCEQMMTCSLALLRDLTDYPVRSGAVLSLHAACMVMKCSGMHLGGKFGHLEFVLASPSFYKLGELLDKAKSGELTLSSEVWDAIMSDDHSELSKILGNAETDKLYAEEEKSEESLVFESSGKAFGVLIKKAYTVLPYKLFDFDDMMEKMPSLSYPPSLATDQRVRSYIPLNVIHYHDAEQGHLLCENRTVSVVFCSLPPSTCSSFENAQRTLNLIQTIIRRFGGIMRQFIMDDKGTVFIAIWGCPPVSNFDDASRAAEASVAFRDALMNDVAGESYHLGIATGPCYCGTYGNARRCEYVVIGCAVNMSARLMGIGLKKAKTTKSSSIFCDFNTHELLSDKRFITRRCGVYNFKGIGEQEWYELENTVVKNDSLDSLRPMFGREKELKIMVSNFSRSLGITYNMYSGSGRSASNTSLLNDSQNSSSKPTSTTVMSERPPFIAYIEGALGFGKTHFVSHFLAAIRTTVPANYFLNHIECVAIEQEMKTPWFAARSLSPILGSVVHALDIDNMKKVALLFDLSSDVHLNINPEILHDSENFVENLDGETRIRNIVDLAMTLLKIVLKTRRILCFIEDSHYLDASTCQLLNAMVHTSKEFPDRLALLFTSRTSTSNKNANVLKDSALQSLKLKRLPKTALVSIALDEFEEAQNITASDDLIAALERHTSGSPLFAIEAVRYLRRKKMITFSITDSSVQFAPEGKTSFGKLKDLHNEATQNTVRLIIDDLSPNARAILKCSAILPPRFKFSEAITLHKALIQKKGRSSAIAGGKVKSFDLDSIPNDEEMRKAKDEITSSKLWASVRTKHAQYQFEHSSWRETVYNSMTSLQRSTLHRIYFHLLKNAKKKERKRSRRRSSQAASFSSTVEWMAVNASLASIHLEAARLYLESAQNQVKSFCLLPANESMTSVFKHIELLSESKNSSEALSKDELIVMNRLRGEIFCLLDRPREGQPFIEESLHLAGEECIKATSDQMLLLLDEETTMQHLHRTFDLREADMSAYLVKDQTVEKATEVMKVCALAFDRLARIYFQSGNPIKAVYCCYRGLNISEAIGHSAELANSYATMAFVKKSPFYGSCSMATAEICNSNVSYCSMLYGGMLIGEGRFHESQLALRQAVSGSTELKDMKVLGLSLSVLGWSMFVSGRFDEALSCAYKMSEIGIEKNDPLFKNWGLTGTIRSFIAKKMVVAASAKLPLIELYIKEYWDSMFNSDRVDIVGSILGLHLLKGDLVKVQETLERFTETIDLTSKPGSQLVEFHGCVTIIEAMIAVTSASNVDFKQKTTAAIDAFTKYSNIYPIFNCRLNYLKGKIALLEKNEENEASKYFRLAISWCRRFDLEYEENLVVLLNKSVLQGYAEIVEMEYERSDSALDGVDLVSVQSKLHVLSSDDPVWLIVVKEVCCELESRWGCKEEKLRQTVDICAMLIRNHTAADLFADDESCRESLTVLSLCLVRYEKRKIVLADMAVKIQCFWRQITATRRIGCMQIDATQFENDTIYPTSNGSIFETMYKGSYEEPIYRKGSINSIGRRRSKEPIIRKSYEEFIDKRCSKESIGRRSSKEPIIRRSLKESIRRRSSKISIRKRSSKKSVVRRSSKESIGNSGNTLTDESQSKAQTAEKNRPVLRLGERIRGKIKNCSWRNKINREKLPDDEIRSQNLSQDIISERDVSL